MTRQLIYDYCNIPLEILGSTIMINDGSRAVIT